MKKAKKILTLVACAVLLVALSVGATIAYLQSTTDVVENTFTVGNVTLDNGLGNGLDEADVNEYGEPIKTTKVENEDGTVTETVEVVEDVEDADRVTENNYKLIANHTYVKDPTVYVAEGSEPCYVYVKVINEIADIEAATNTIAAQMTAKGWVALGEDYPNIYYYDANANDAVIGTVINNLEGTDPVALVVFEKFTIKAEADEDTLDDYTDNKITIQAYALQADGFADAVEAYGSAPCSAWTPVEAE